MASNPAPPQAVRRVPVAVSVAHRESLLTGNAARRVDLRIIPGMSQSEYVHISLFEVAVDVPQWLDADRDINLDERLRRDRALGLEIGAGDPARRVCAWWRRVGEGARPAAGRRLHRARVVVTLLLAVAGAIVGAALTLAVFGYEGRYPVNVVAALALLVGVPLMMMTLTLLLLPGRLPGLHPLQDALAAINVGNLAAGIYNAIARPAPEDGGPMLGWPAARSGAAARFAKWQVMLWSQVAGLCFSIGALVMAFLLVVFTDLAFGWSTTLDVDANEVALIVNGIAAPWAAWLPAAVPDAELLAESRFFRLQDAGVPRVDAGRLTGWWPFVLMALIVYGVIPRLLLLLLASWRLAAATRAMLLDDTGVRALLDRMDNAALELNSNGGTDPEPGRPVAGTAGPGRLRIAERARVIVWNRALEGPALDTWLRRQLGGDGVVQLVHAGDFDGSDAPAALAALSPDDATLVLVLTRAWEPPMLDFLDFLEELRQRVGSGVSVVVVPVGINGAAPDETALKTWRHSVARLPDSGVYVEALSS